MAEGSSKPLDDQGVCDLASESTETARKCSSKCLNYMCKSGTDLFTPPIFCLSYYRVKKSSASQLICKACYDLALEHFDELRDKLETGQSLMSANIPLRDELFVLDDSDEEDTNKVEPEVPIDEDTMVMLIENFDDALEKALQSVDVSKQIDDAVEHIEDQLDVNSSNLFQIQGEPLKRGRMFTGWGRGI